MQPVLIATALDSERDNAGGVFGASMFFTGGLSSPLTGIGNLLVASSIVIFAGALVCLLLVLPLCRRMRE